MGEPVTGPRMRVIRDGDSVTYVAPGVLLPEEHTLLAAAGRPAPSPATVARASLTAQLRALDASMTALKKAQQPHSDGVALARRYGYLN